MVAARIKIFLFTRVSEVKIIFLSGLKGRNDVKTFYHAGNAIALNQLINLLEVTETNN